jgi:exopolysaccharide biosynthesis polyprenyl glycosylphosphotransferase
MKSLINIVQRLVLYLLLKKRNLVNFLLGAVDLCALGITFQLSYNLINPEGKSIFFFLNSSFLLLFMLMVPSWIIIFHICNIAQIPRTSQKGRIFFEYIEFTVLNLLVLLFFRFIVGRAAVPVSFAFVFAASALALLYAIRLVEYRLLKWYRAKGYNYLNVILIADDSSEFIIRELLLRKEWGYRILLIFSDSLRLRRKYGYIIKILPERSAKTLSNLLEVDIVDEVFFLKQEAETREIRSIMKSCEEIGVVFRLRTEAFSFFLTNGKISKLGNTRFITFANIPSNSFGIALKSALDIYFSLIMLTILSPVLLIIAILVATTSPGPILFRQARVGLRGRQFYLYKFRTMIANAEQLKAKLAEKNEMDGPVFKIKDDPRITKVGKFLRKTGLDELPQLFNVLKGEMSLIGPRPPLQIETRQYKRWQLRRLSVKPGISCSWQISPNRNEVKFDNWMKLDLAYIDNWSPSLDLKLLFKTVKTVLKGTGS